MSEPNLSKKERRESARAARVEAERKAAAAEQRKRRLSLLGGVVALAAIVVVAAILISSSGDSEPNLADNAGVVGVAETNAMFDGIPQEGMVLGASTAPATLHQAEDPQCPVCKTYSETVLPQVIEDQVRTGKAKVQTSLFAFIGADSDRGAAFTVAASRQDRGFQALELIYRNQGTENSGYMTDDYLREIAAAAGLDVDRVMRDMTLPAVTAEVERQGSFAQTNGATGTPTLWSQKGDGDLTQIEDFQDVAGIGEALA